MKSCTPPPVALFVIGGLLLVPVTLLIVATTAAFGAWLGGLYAILGAVLSAGAGYGLGLLPFAIELLPLRARPNIEWRGVPFITGIFTTVIQFMAGVGGLFLDIFFQKSMLDRKTTSATKAVVQSLSHVVRGVYFGSISGLSDVPLWACVPAIVLAVAGTSLAPYVLKRMTDHGFRQWTRAIIFVISTIYLVRAATLFWYG
jgi:uncharacterized membrane protein YfcA